MSCGVGHRQGLDLALLCLWLRSAAAAPTRPLAWEPPYATGAALKRLKKKNPLGRKRIWIALSFINLQVSLAVQIKARFFWLVCFALFREDRLLLSLNRVALIVQQPSKGPSRRMGWGPVSGWGNHCITCRSTCT